MEAKKTHWIKYSFLGGAGKLDIPRQKNEIRLILYYSQNWLKMDWILKYEAETTTISLKKM